MADVPFSGFSAGTLATVVGLDGGGANTKQALAPMDKGVYDPQNAGKISGDTTGVGAGGVLSMVAGANPAGSITTDATTGTGGSINTGGGSGGSGGSVLTYGGTGVAGGFIDTYGDTSAGGSIDTHDGGGSINTRGVGLIELGAVGTRTSLVGTASADRSISLPNKAGTLAIDVADVEAASSITPAADNTYLTPTSITIVKGIITAIS